MPTRLRDSEYEMYSLLTSRTFYVVDTEYTPAPRTEGGGNRIISIAVVPVVSGRRLRPQDELYLVMNPEVPITPGSMRVHGFTEAAVQNKPIFADCARQIVDFFDDPNGVFVAHTPADIYALRGELKRLDERRNSGETTIAVGLHDLPDLPLLDTSTLPRLVQYPGLGSSGIIGLSRLVELTDVSYRNAHDARGDARATADALLELLTHAARQGAFTDIDDLLGEHRAGTTLSPRGPSHFRRHRDEYILPPGHINKHLTPLTDKATNEELDAWVEMAVECAQMRCPWLRDEAVVAAEKNAPALARRISSWVPFMTDPGQSGTLIGALKELILFKEGQEPGYATTAIVRWWSGISHHIRSLPPCTGKPESSCPACLDGDTCPKDDIYEIVAEAAVLGRSRYLKTKDIKKIFEMGSLRWTGWRDNHPDLFGWVAWYAINEYNNRDRLTAASQALEICIRRKDHLLDPRLARMACDYLVSMHDDVEAIRVAQAVLVNRNTNPAYADLEMWLAWALQNLNSEEPPEPPRPLQKRLSRPVGRVPKNPYRVRR